MAVFPSDSIRTKNWGTEILTDADLESQLDLLHAYFQAALHSSTGHTHDGTSNQGPKIASGGVSTTFVNGFTTVTGVSTDYLLISDTSDSNANKKALASDFVFVPSAANALAGSIVQVVNVNTGAVGTGSTTTPNDDTIPQITEGNEILSTSYTPLSVTNKLMFIANVTVNESTNTGSAVAVALHRATVNDALAVSTADATSYAGTSAPYPTTIVHYMTAPGTSAYTFSIRAGCDTGPVTWNGTNSARKYGGVLISSLTIIEVKA